MNPGIVGTIVGTIWKQMVHPGGARIHKVRTSIAWRNDTANNEPLFRDEPIPQEAKLNREEEPSEPERDIVSPMLANPSYLSSQLPRNFPPPPRDKAVWSEGLDDTYVRNWLDLIRMAATLTGRGGNGFADEGEVHRNRRLPSLQLEAIPRSLPAPYVYIALVGFFFFEVDQFFFNLFPSGDQWGFVSICYRVIWNYV